jgi:hypothetical protein
MKRWLRRSNADPTTLYPIIDFSCLAAKPGAVAPSQT